jgi:hypothetical protein
MLLRYVFRSISAGKFEESYKELLPLLPTVLNGLYRASISDSPVLRNTAIELCLTIPARLSSLLPHLNLLLRVIVPALDSDSGDLINLGLRTLEFWIDNLNPLFVYPEMTKQSSLFVSLMQSLSRHLRPAPYPYGLLTLRLLGKLGGNNREFLQEPLPQDLQAATRDTPSLSVSCTMSGEGDSRGLTLCLPLSRCETILHMISCRDDNKRDADDDTLLHTLSEEHGRESKTVASDDDLQGDQQRYGEDVVDKTLARQAEACMVLIRQAIASLSYEAESDISNTSPRRSETLACLCRCLLFGASIGSISVVAKSLLMQLYVKGNRKALHDGFVSFLSQRPLTSSTNVAASVVASWSQLVDADMKSLLTVLCHSSCSSISSSAPLQAILDVVDVARPGFDPELELLLVSTAIVAIKSVPREFSNKMIEAIRFFVLVCESLYGESWPQEGAETVLIWDILSSEGPAIPSADMRASASSTCPVDDVFRMLLIELASSQPAMR